MGGVSDLIGGAGTNPAISAALVAGYGVKKLLDDAKEADPAMAKLGDSIAKMVGPASQTTEALNRVNVALSAIVGLAKNVFSTTLAKNMTMATAAIGAFTASIGNLLQFFGASKIGSSIAEVGEGAMAAAYNDMTGGSGRGGVVEMEKKLEEAKERRKRRDQAAREAARGQGSNRISEGFQGSAGLYVTSGAAMIGSQSLAIQRSMLRELQSLTRATDRVRDTIRDTAYTS
jgi:HAMP domain-containing protein